MALLALFPCIVAAGTNYIYDDLGRVIQATNSDGTATAYQYDANGNITSIKRLAATALAISGIAPTSVRAGGTLTIIGVGFSATPTANGVTIGGAAATVTAATATSLTVTVPMNANTGLVTVTVGSSTVASPRPVNILKPMVNNFSPTLVNPGASVTLSGANLNLVPGSTTVNVGGAAATITYITNSSITIIAPAMSGAIQVVTPYGSASSSGLLTNLPANINLNDVIASGTATPGGSPVPLNLNQQNKLGVVSINVAQGSYVSLQLTDYVASYSTDYEVRSPSNAVIASGSVNNWALTVHLPKAATGGTYLVLFSSWRAPLQLKATAEVSPILSANASLTGVTGAASQSKRFIISGVAGHHFGVALTNLVTTPGWIDVSLYRPDGSRWWGRGCQAWDPLSSCGLQFVNLPVTGEYVLYATPNSQAGMSFNLATSEPIETDLSSGAPQPFTTTVPGQFVLETFTAIAGQAVALNIGSLSTTPANNNFYISIMDPNYNWVTDRSTTGDTVFNLTDLQAGTYHVLIVPWFGLTGSGQVTVANSTSTSIPTNGTTLNFSTTVPGQNAYMTFDATAGDNIGIGLTNLVTAPSWVSSASVTVYAPNGSMLTQRGCYIWDPLSSCGQQPFNLPQTGTYKIVVSPSGMATMNFNMTLSHAQTGNLVPGAPFTANSSVPGQFSLLNFTVSPDQPVTINLASVATSPAGNNTYMAIVDSNGNNLTNASTTSGTTLNPTLAPGNYRVFWVPYFAVTGTAQITLVGNPTPTLAVDGTTAHYGSAVTGQAMTFLIPETAGDDFGVGVTNLVTGSGHIDMNLYAPNGQWVWGRTCYVWDPLASCGLQYTDLAQTGNYKLVATPQGDSTMSFDLTLSRPIAPTLIAGVPQTLATTLPGQFVWLDFNGTSGHSASLTVDQMATNPPNVYTWGSLSDPNNNNLGYQGTPNPMTFNFNMVNGTHHFFWIPYYAVMGSARFSLTVN